MEELPELSSEHEKTVPGESHSVFARVPPELFVMMAAYASLASRLVIPQVCRRWAVMCSGGGIKWTVLDFSDVTVVSVALIARLLLRSGTAAVEVRNLSLQGDRPRLLGPTPPFVPLQAVAMVLTQHMPRITVLEINLLDYSPSQSLVHALIQPAPLLRRARLLSTTSELLPLGLFGGKLGAPLLRELVVSNYNCQDHLDLPAVSALHRLTHLSLLPSARHRDIHRLLNMFPTIDDVDIGEVAINQLATLALPPEIAARLSIRIKYRLDRQNVPNLERMPSALMRNISASYVEGYVLPILFDSADDADTELSLSPSFILEQPTIALCLRMSRNRRRFVASMFVRSFHDAFTLLSERRVFQNVRKLAVSCLELLLHDTDYAAKTDWRSYNPAVIFAYVPSKWSSLFPNLDEVDFTLPPVSRNSSTVFGDENIRDILSRSRRVTLRAQPGETYSVSWQTFCVGFTTPTAEPKLSSPDELRLHGVHITVPFDA